MFYEVEAIKMKLWIIALVALVFLPAVIADCCEKEVFTATYNLCDNSRMYNPECDFTGDGCVDLPDLVYFAGYMKSPSCEKETTVPPALKNYYPSRKALEEGYTKCMKIGKRIYFDDFNGVKQSVSLKNTEGGTANFAFSFDEEFSFLPGDRETFDVNGDGVDDYSVEMLSFCSENRAEFLVTALFETEEVVEEEPKEEAPVEEKPSVIPSDNRVSKAEPTVGNAITGQVVADTESTGNGFSEWLKNLFGF